MDAIWFQFLSVCGKLGIEAPSPREVPQGVGLVRLVRMLERVEVRVWKRMERRPRSIQEAQAIDDRYTWVDPNGPAEAAVVERRERLGRDRFWAYQSGYIGVKIDPRPHAAELGYVTTHEGVIEAQAGQERIRTDSMRRQKERDANRAKQQRKKARRAAGR